MTTTITSPESRTWRRRRDWAYLAALLCIVFATPAASQNAAAKKSMPSQSASSVSIGARLDRMLQQGLPSQWIAIGVTFRQAGLPATGRAREIAIQAGQQRILNALARGSFQVKRRYRALSGMALWVQRPAIEALSQHVEVEFLYLDAKVHAVLAQGVGLVGGDTAHAMGYTGSGVKVAVLDTGIDIDRLIPKDKITEVLEEML